MFATTLPDASSPATDPKSSDGISRAFSNCLRASSWMSPAICGSELSISGMGGICITDLLATRLHTPAGAGHRGRAPGTVRYLHGEHHKKLGKAGEPGHVHENHPRLWPGGRWMSALIILGCDPGIDPALAIAFAHGRPDIQLAGITTVAGNVGLAQTTANALAVCEVIGAGQKIGSAHV